MYHLCDFVLQWTPLIQTSGVTNVKSVNDIGRNQRCKRNVVLLVTTEQKYTLPTKKVGEKNDLFDSLCDWQVGSKPVAWLSDATSDLRVLVWAEQLR